MHDDLLIQARELAQADPTKPKQANLRRAVSSAYYSLFHFLIDASCRATIGTQHAQIPYRQAIARAFAHGTMRQACDSFARQSLPSGISKLQPLMTFPAGISGIARTFVETQEKRHLADYDLSESFSRADVLGLIQQVEGAIEQFQKLSNSNEKKFYLASLWAWSGLKRR